MRISVIIAAHNEGDLLWKTLRSTIEATERLDCEILIADDASSDGCVEESRRRYPQARVVSFPERRGCSSAKDLGARKARGDVLVFLDGHCKPEPFSIHQLARDVEELRGEAIITPAVPSLDVETWRSTESVGHGYTMSLLTFGSNWLPLRRLRPSGDLFECPALVGCCLAMSKDLYLRLCGFDPDMIEWGVEDVDLGLKAWLLGSGILHDPNARIAHRFRSGFTNFTVRSESVLANQIRAARKNLAEPLWREWRRRAEKRSPKGAWARAWALFEGRRASAEEERRYLLAQRVRDEDWYARRFGLPWPARRRASE